MKIIEIEWKILTICKTYMKRFILQEDIELKKLKSENAYNKSKLQELYNYRDIFTDVNECKKLLTKYNIAKLELSYLISQKHANELKIIELNKKIDNLKTTIKELHSFWPNFLRNKEKIDKEKRALEVITNHQILQNDLLKQNKSFEKKIEEEELNIEKLTILIDKYNIFDLNQNTKFIEEISIRNIDIEKKIENLNFKKKQILDNFKEKINELNKNIDIYNELLDFQNELNQGNSYERKLLHEKIERKFGNGNINKLLSKYKGSINNAIPYIERNIDKIRSSTDQKYRKWIVQNSCEKLLLDGNNLLYSKTNKKLGLERVLFLAHYLCEIYDVTIVFDSNFNHNDIKILQEAIPPSVKITCANRGEKADDLLISLGNNKKNTYIVSNDNFIEYSTNEIIRDKRVIQHDISENFIRIPMLDIIKEY